MIDQDIIRLCIQACINSYKGEYGEVKKVFDNAINFTVKHTEGHYAIHNNILYIVYQGSNGKKDWFDNLKFWHKDLQKAKPYGNLNTDIKIHAGFMEQYLLVRAMIHRIVNETEGYFKIICVGHSLGGALAQLTAIDIQFNFPNRIISCVTFGSPKVGNEAFAESYNRRIPMSYRVVNGKDIVPMVPPAIFGNKHADMIIPIGKRTWYKLFSTDDHYPNLYQKNYEISLKST